MDVYMAGGINGNCKPMFTDLAKVLKGLKPMGVYLAGAESRPYVITEYVAKTMKGGGGENMDLYLAGNWPWKKNGLYDEAPNASVGTDGLIDIAILESFYYADEWTEAIIPKLRKFLLDSGAFTFFTAGKHVDWNEYVDRYIEFVKRNNVRLFFELDIDVLVGYPKVLELRRRLEAGTGRRCIPVWHKSRGKAEFLKMCDEYDYVAIGGIVSKEITPPDYKYFPWFIREAHRRGAKIHGLGFTNLEGLTKYHFDSVDSTSWTTGNRFGLIYSFDGRTMQKTKAPTGKGLKDSRAAAVRNFNEWVKFQKYAEKNL